MFQQFPKTRPELPPEMAAIYAEHYKSNREGRTSAASLAQKAEAWLHRQVAGDLTQLGRGSKSTLEIGAGTLNQLRHEPQVGPYDVIEPFGVLYADSPYRDRVRSFYADITEIPANLRYNRITSCATFEHILNLPEVVARAALLLAPGGVMRTAIPSEGTFLWALGWRLTTGMEFRLRHGQDYGILMRHEHVNTAREIREVLGHFFETNTGSCLGLAPSVSLYQAYVSRSPRLDRCRDYLAGSG